MDPKRRFGMARVFLDLQKIRLEMAGTSNDSGAYQLQFAILAVPWVGLLATVAERSKGSCQAGNTGNVVQDLCTIRTHSSRRGRSDFGLLRLAVFVAHGFLFG